MMTVYFLMDKRKAYKGSKTVPILADVKYEYSGHIEHFRFSIGLTCNPKYFRSQAISPGEPNSQLKNSALIKLKSSAEEIYLSCIEAGKMPDKNEIKARLINSLKEAEREKNTLDILDDYIASLKARKKSISFIQGMQNLRKVLENLRSKGISIRLDDIDLSFETQFRSLLNNTKIKPKSSQTFDPNTVNSYVKRLKIFMNYALKNNLHNNRIYQQFELREEAREIIALSEIEVATIANLPLPTHKHIHSGGTKLSRDWFIVSTQTGLRYSDFAKLSVAELIPVSGGYDIHIKTQKTKAPVVIPVSRLLYKILKEYNMRIPPPPSNQKYNEGLKVIAEKAELTKSITSHTGRKTFCTLQYKKGIPVNNIMKMTGHKTEKEFYKYIGVSLSENAALVREKDSEYYLDTFAITQ